MTEVSTRSRRHKVSEVDRLLHKLNLYIPKFSSFSLVFGKLMVIALWTLNSTYTFVRHNLTVTVTITGAPDHDSILVEVDLGIHPQLSVIPTACYPSYVILCCHLSLLYLNVTGDKIR